MRYATLIIPVALWFSVAGCERSSDPPSDAPRIGATTSAEKDDHNHKAGGGHDHSGKDEDAHKDEGGHGAHGEGLNLVQRS